MDITRNMNGARALVVGAGLALAMGAAPTPALAAGRVGTTKVMVRTEIDNVEFKVPTVIPFVAKADGTVITVNIGEDEADPIFYITDLLPHLAAPQKTRPPSTIIRPTASMSPT